ncbi:MAG TPA: hypothetical protein VGQ76_16595 [Thermoanaerobaculia bacterium]|nr:hypothetical protein [Thermoanaerobaculia bacterium]
MSESHEALLPPFYITPEEEMRLRIRANQLVPSPAISTASSFDDFVRQLMIPTSVMELARKASSIHFSAWETEAIRASLSDGILKTIVDDKYAKDRSHPAYVRVACTGKGDYDHLSPGHESQAQSEEHLGDFGSPVVLEIWPGQHYSPVHSHGRTTGIIYCLTGQIDVMLYDWLAWDAEKVGLLTLTPGQCAWLSESRFPVHKVFCPMSEGNFAATFHVYLNRDELPLLRATPKPDTRDQFDFVEETPPHEKKAFATYSDLSWGILRREMSRFESRERA